MAMMYCKDRNKVVMINRDMVLTQIDISGSGRTVRVKLSMKTDSLDTFHALWVGHSLLMTSSEEQILRFWVSLLLLQCFISIAH